MDRSLFAIFGRLVVALAVLCAGARAPQLASADPLGQAASAVRAARDDGYQLLRARADAPRVVVSKPARGVDRTGPRLREHASFASLPPITASIAALPYVGPSGSPSLVASRQARVLDRTELMVFLN